MTESFLFSIPSCVAPPGRVTASNEMEPISRLEESLAGSETEASEAVNAARERVKSLAEQAERGLRRGASSNDFAALSALVRACEAAQDILNKASHSTRQGARM